MRHWQPASPCNRFDVVQHHERHAPALHGVQGLQPRQRNLALEILLVFKRLLHFDFDYLNHRIFDTLTAHRGEKPQHTTPRTHRAFAEWQHVGPHRRRPEPVVQQLADGLVVSRVAHLVLVCAHEQNRRHSAARVPGGARA